MMHACTIICVLQLLSISGAMESDIVGGNEAMPHSRPYMASLQDNCRNHVCGGILIREDFVLTAAHCERNEPMTVVLGAHDITKNESQQRIEVKNYIPHPQYKQQYDYDIMLLKLKYKVKLDDDVKIIALPKKDKKLPANIKCDVAGWGKTGDKSVPHKRHPSPVLRENMEKLQFSNECVKKWKDYFKPSRMICTTFTINDGGVCQGDSGGPLICKNKLRGITAFTYRLNCNDPFYPHVFTKVSAFLPWIKETMKRLGDDE